MRRLNRNAAVSIFSNTAGSGSAHPPAVPLQTGACGHVPLLDTEEPLVHAQPWRGRVAAGPDDAEPPAVTQYPGDLRDRAVGVHPVPR